MFRYLVSASRASHQGGEAVSAGSGRDETLLEV